MTLLKVLASRKIILWGIGAIQRDIEELFPEIHAAYYVDDRAEAKKGRVSSSVMEKVRETSALGYENKNEIMVIICEQEQGKIANKLDALGLCEKENYISYGRLLFEYPTEQFIERFIKSQIAVWGCGKSYEDYKEGLQNETQGVCYLIDVGAKTAGIRDEHPVYSKEEGLKKLNGMPIVVASTYYPVICDELESMGLRPGKDILFCDTFLQLCQYANIGDGPYCFKDRRKGKSHLLLVLAGYKAENWNEVFGRISKYVPACYDVCILSSGLRSEVLDRYCQENGWSYLSTKANKISSIQNLAIYLHREAEWVAKMDEDIYLTEGTLEVLENTYLEAEKNSRYEVGFVSPLIPVNTYGYVRVLDMMKKHDEWEERFGKAKLTDGLHHHLRITEDPDAADFLWEKFDIDAYSKAHGLDQIKYSICPARYSIGMILYQKETWIDMKYFPNAEGTNMGLDEEWFCNYCMMHSKVMVIAENTAVGHLGYKGQGRKSNRVLDRGE